MSFSVAGRRRIDTGSTFPRGVRWPDERGQWIGAAIEQAEKSWAGGEIPIGSVLVDGADAVVSAGHDERVQSGDSTAHAEMACSATVLDDSRCVVLLEQMRREKPDPWAEDPGDPGK